MLIHVKVFLHHLDEAYLSGYDDCGEGNYHYIFANVWATNDDGDEQIINGDEIIKLPNGRLTTMYHYMKNSDTQIEEVLVDTKFENVDL